MITINDTPVLNMTQATPPLPEHLYARRGDFKRQTTAPGLSTGTSIGLAVGCVLGMINATLAVFISPFFIPGLNVLVNDPVTATLAGAALGSAFGAVFGFLLEWGINRQQHGQMEADTGFTSARD